MPTARNAILAAVLALLLISGCARQAQVEQTEPPAAQTPTFIPAALPSLTPPALQSTELSPTPTAASRPTPPPLQDPRYELTAELDYDQHRLKVEERIRYTNRSPDALPELVLLVEPATYQGTFQLESMSWVRGQAITEFTLQDNQMRIPLPLPLHPGETLELSITYQLSLPSPVPSPTTRPVPFGYTARQVNLVDWYPFIPPYIPGQGWLAHTPGYYGEHLAYETADFTINLRLTEPRANLIIAASAPAQIDGEWRRYQHDDARNFAWSASPYYQVITSTVGQTTITSYAFQVHEAANQAVLQTTSQALELYSRLLSPYPRRTFSVVEADFLDGMEYDGLYFLSKGFYNLYTGTPGEYLVCIAAHETAHQWWYAMLGNDQALEPWLDEALSTYSEALFYENYHPEALKWWWDYRIYYYQPRGWVDDSIYNPHGEAQAFLSYRDAVYLNGAVFLDELRKLIGDQAFFAFLRAYTTENAGKLVSANEFFTILREHTQANIQPLVDKYFYKQ